MIRIELEIEATLVQHPTSAKQSSCSKTSRRRGLAAYLVPQNGHLAPELRRWLGKLPTTWCRPFAVLESCR